MLSDGPKRSVGKRRGPAGADYSRARTSLVGHFDPRPSFPELTGTGWGCTLLLRAVTLACPQSGEEAVVPQYGYRVFAVELHDGLKQDPLEFGAAARPIVSEDGTVADGKHVYDYRNAMVAEVESHLGRAHSFGGGTDDDETGPAQGRSTTIRFHGAKRSEDYVYLTFEHGVTNADGTLLDGAAVIDMKDKPTLHPYRALLYAPAKTKVGLLAVETRGRTCPHLAVVRGLKNCSEVPWRLQVLGHLAGEAAMLAFLRRASVNHVVFDRWTYDDAGARDHRDVSMTVAASGVDAQLKQSVAGWASAQFRRVAAARKESRISYVDDEGNEVPAKEIRAQRKAAKEAVRSAVVDGGPERTRKAVDSLKQDVFVSRGETVEVGFNDVGVEVSDRERTMMVTPHTDFTKFTYPLGRSRPEDEAFFNRVEATVVELHPAVEQTPLTE